VRGTSGELYPVKPDIFARKYEHVDTMPAVQMRDDHPARKSLANLIAFVGVMYGDRDGNVPAIVTTPLQVPVKLGKMFDEARAAYDAP
jgi:hypothetical protein